MTIKNPPPPALGPAARVLGGAAPGRLRTWAMCVGTPRPRRERWRPSFAIVRELRSVLRRDPSSEVVARRSTRAGCRGAGMGPRPRKTSVPPPWPGEPQGSGRPMLRLAQAPWSNPCSPHLREAQTRRPWLSYRQVPTESVPAIDQPCRRPKRGAERVSRHCSTRRRKLDATDPAPRWLDCLVEVRRTPREPKRVRRGNAP